MDIFVSAITNQDINEFCFIQFGYNEELFNDVADIIIDCKTEEHISLKLDDDFFRFGHYSNWESVRKANPIKIKFISISMDFISYLKIFKMEFNIRL